MSSRVAAMAGLCFAIAAPAEAYAQEADAPSAERLIANQRAEVRESLGRPEECAADAMQPDTIVVCGEIAERESQTQEVMSPLPAPVQSDRNLVTGLRVQPCWVSNPGGLCMRGGWAPPPIYLIDLDAIPEALSEQDAALVFRAEAMPAEVREEAVETEEGAD